MWSTLRTRAVASTRSTQRPAIPWAASGARDASVPAAVDAEGNVYVVTADRYVYAVNPQGRYIWRQLVRVDHMPMARPVVAGNTLFVTTGQGGIYAFDTATGTLKWSYTIQ